MTQQLSRKPIRIQLTDQLLIPFGCPKWEISKIKIAGVSPEATYFESDTPCVCINKQQQNAVRLQDFPSIFPKLEFPSLKETWEALNFMRDYLKENCELQSPYEKRFLDLYFNHCRKAVMFRNNVPSRNFDWVFHALLPIPQAHFYLKDPLTTQPKMVKVDFAFWTGEQLVLVEIDSPNKSGLEIICRDNMFKAEGIKEGSVHILNSELDEFGEKIISSRLPESITKFWIGSTPGILPYNPLFSDIDIPF